MTIPSIDSTKTVIDNGPNAERANLVLVSEGYQEKDERKFVGHCEELARAIESEPWYQRIGRETLNVHLVFVASIDPGNWINYGCPGKPRNTPFKAHFCSGGSMVRAIRGNIDDAKAVARRAFPDVTCTGVLLNIVAKGGTGNLDAFWSTAGRNKWTAVALHELGHGMFKLADEYGGEGSAAGWREPSRPNLTLETDPARVKWRHLISRGIALPTLRDGEKPAPGLEDVVGLFEGGGYRDRGIYRPALNCRMRSSGEPFCEVCEEHIVSVLERWAPAPPTIEVPAEKPNMPMIEVRQHGKTREFDDNVAGAVAASQWMLENLFG